MNDNELMTKGGGLLGVVPSGTPDQVLPEEQIGLVAHPPCEPAPGLLLLTGVLWWWGKSCSQVSGGVAAPAVEQAPV